MPKGPTSRLAFDCDHHTHRSLKTLAATDGTTIRALISAALVDLLTARGVEPSGDLARVANRD